MFSMFASIESLYFITKCFWNIGVSKNFSAKYTCRSSLFTLFVKKVLLKSPRIFVSSLKCFLERSPLLDRIFCFKLFLKYLFLSESANSRSVVFLLISQLFVKSDKSMIIAESLVLEFCTVVVKCGKTFQYIRFATMIEWICIFGNTLGNIKELRFK